MSTQAASVNPSWAWKHPAAPAPDTITEVTARIVATASDDALAALMNREERHPAETLAWVENFINRNGYSPTVKEICGGMHMKRTACERHLAMMERTGKIVRRGPGKHRNIALLSCMADRDRCPFCKQAIPEGRK